VLEELKLSDQLYTEIEQLRRTVEELMNDLQRSTLEKDKLCNEVKFLKKKGSIQEGKIKLLIEKLRKSTTIRKQVGNENENFRKQLNSLMKLT
jgi:hypothetical protein